jgi:hypothetical protein
VDVSSKHRPFLWKAAYEKSGDEDERLVVRLAVSYIEFNLLTEHLGLISRASGGANIPRTPFGNRGC